MNRNFPANLQHRLDDIIYSCGMVVNITPLYTKSGLVCASDVESAFYTTRTVDRYICLYCGAQDFDAASFRQLRKQYKTVFPICVHCRSNCKEEIKLNELKVKAQKKVPDLLQRSLSFLTPSSTQTKINSCTTSTNLLSAPQTNTSSSDTSKVPDPLQRSLFFLAPTSTQTKINSCAPRPICCSRPKLTPHRPTRRKLLIRFKGHYPSSLHHLRKKICCRYPKHHRPYQLTFRQPCLRLYSQPAQKIQQLMTQLWNSKF